MQTLIDRALPDIHFIYVHTGWAAACWSERISVCTDYAQKNQVQVHHLKAQSSFSEMVIDRKQFPSRKFQWCAGFLKGLTILNYLDEHDPSCEALIVSGKRRLDSRRYANLEEFELQNELYQGRTLWYPLWQTDNEEFMHLVQKTGFKLLPHASMECSPCIHMNRQQLKNLDSFSLERLQSLENNIQRTMFPESIDELCANSATRQKEYHGLQLEQFDLGCGAPWNCGE
ncbi:Phosphoadenosine phosphosulfate reductase family [Legionella lansingensis]|uniref:Phosphoadenosine phosphosulphate reductase domain-containing protein n=2 Tax=Legionella lansingensis TaxID=45067 RepID=A0A0W0VKC1_9GAMM|nr:hypothetical protein Llan_1815 [Legionella lansingensis]SNV47771.1 Phosphoadenosine phosphosulfate reductase family [Legionella lansingensis]